MVDERTGYKKIREHRPIKSPVFSFLKVNVLLAIEP